MQLTYDMRRISSGANMSDKAAAISFIINRTLNRQLTKKRCNVSFMLLIAAPSVSLSV